MKLIHDKLEKSYQNAARKLYKKELRELTAKEWEKVIAHVLNQKEFTAKLKATKQKIGRQRTVVYNTMEVLPGPLVINALNSLVIYQDTVKIMQENGMDPSLFDKIPDSALGNGGLGRLAADFAEAAASSGYLFVLNGLFYWKGLHKQEFDESGRPVRQPDEWAKDGQPWLIPNEKEAVVVDLGVMGRVKAVPMQMTIYGSRKFSTCVDLPAIFWNVEPISGEPNPEFARKICEHLYPADDTDEGKLLRLAQEMVFTDAMIQSVFKRHKKIHGTLDNIDKLWAFQMNDTHPVMGCLSFIYYMMQEGYSFEDAFQKARKCWFYTNHTVMSEALEKWPRHLFQKIAPHLEKIVGKINDRLIKELCKEYPHLFVMANDAPIWENIHPYEMFDQKGNIMMANIACYVAAKINGVAAVHSDIIKRDTLGQWGGIYPNKFCNVTNGVHPGTWIISANPELAELLYKYAGDGWCADMSKLEQLIPHRNNPLVLEEFAVAKKKAKRRLLARIKAKEGIEIGEDFFIIAQVKRIHEYKRQSMNILAILKLYEDLKAGKLPNFTKTAFLIGGKAAASYKIANDTIHFIKQVANMINNDPEVNDRLRLVFLTNFDVSYAKLIYAGSDLSVQISQAGTEASGTGNMKFMMNGAVTIGTRDGANIEIAGRTGDAYQYMFGASVYEFRRIAEMYNHIKVLASNPEFEDLLKYMWGYPSIEGDFRDLAHNLQTDDRYRVFYDLPEYYETLLKAIKDYGEEQRTGVRNFTKKALMNIAWSGHFSSVRSIREYASLIWGIQPIDMGS